MVNQDQLEQKETSDLRKLLKSNSAETPWCTIMMVIGIVACHTLVLVGNMQTSGGINTIGVSTGGWSHVGVSLGESIHMELDESMKNITTMLSAAINETLGVQKNSRRCARIGGPYQKCQPNWQRDKGHDADTGAWHGPYPPACPPWTAWHGRARRRRDNG